MAKPQRAPTWRWDTEGEWFAQERCGQCGKEPGHPDHGPRASRNLHVYRQELYWARV